MQIDRYSSTIREFLWANEDWRKVGARTKVGVVMPSLRQATPSLEGVSMPLSPYRTGMGIRPIVLAGRDDLIARAGRVLDGLGTERSSGGMTIFVGPPGVGKTVLLKEIEKVAQQRNLTVCWLACDEVSDNIHLLASRTAESIQSLSTPAGFSEIFKDRLRSLNVEFTMYGIKLASQPSKTDERVDRRQALREVLADAATHVTKHSRSGMLVLVDEYHNLPSDQRVIFETAVHDIFHANATTPLAFFGAGLTSSSDRAANSYGDRFEFEPVHRLDVSEAEVALTGPATTLGVAWDDDARKFALSATAGWPYLIQQVGDETWHQANPEPGETMRMEHVRPAIQQVWTRLAYGVFQSRWRSASSDEQRFMLAMASGADSTGATATTEIFRLAGNAGWQIRSALQDRGIIERASRGVLRFTVPGFAEYILQQGEEDILSLMLPTTESTNTPALES